MAIIIDAIINYNDSVIRHENVYRTTLSSIENLYEIKMNTNWWSIKPDVRVWCREKDVLFIHHVMSIRDAWFEVPNETILMEFKLMWL